MNLGISWEKPVCAPAKPTAGTQWTGLFCALLLLFGCLGCLDMWQAAIWAAGMFLLLTGLRATRLRSWALPGAALALFIACLCCPEAVRLGVGALQNGWREAVSTRFTRIILPLSGEESPIFWCISGGILGVLATAGLTGSSCLTLLAALCCICTGEHFLFLIPLLAGWMGTALVRTGWSRALAVCLLTLIAAGALLPLANQLPPPQWQKAAGRLDRIAPRPTGDKTVLTVTMTKPQRMYLRGFVGQRYTSDGWQALEPETLAGWQDTFYWLHEAGFYGQTVPALAAQAAGSQELGSLQISGGGYLPTGLASAEMLEERRYPDDRAVNGDTFTCQYQVGGLTSWFQSQIDLAASQPQAYLALEGEYRAFVYDAYLALPPSAGQLLGQLVGDAQPRTLPEIQSAIRAFLDEHLTYDETVQTNCGQVDFLNYLLQGQKRGYSVHYATTAVCLLRYFGVPARYASGYFLPEDATEQVPERFAHAWAEYYLDGVGWIPFEVTPGYEEEELELENLLLDPNSSFHTAVSQTYTRPPSNQTPQAPVQQETPDQGNQNRAHLPGWSKWALLALLLASLLAALGLLARKPLRRLAHLRAMERMTPKEAIPEWYAYACHWLRRAGRPIPDDWAAADNREALFSSHPMTEEQRQRMKAYAQAARHPEKTDPLSQQ